MGEGGVEVLDDGDAGGRGRGGDPVPDDGVAVLLGHRDDVALDPVGVGLDGGVVPAGGSGGHPVVEVLGERAEADQGVVRGAAAQDAGPRVADEGVAARLLHGRVVVVEVAAEQAEPVTQFQDPLQSHVGRSALDDAHGGVGVLGEPVRDHRSRGAAADDDVVERGFGCCHRSLLASRHSRDVRCGPGLRSAGVRNRTSAAGAGRGCGRGAWPPGTRPVRRGRVPVRSRNGRTRPIRRRGCRGRSR